MFRAPVKFWFKTILYITESAKIGLSTKERREIGTIFWLIVFSYPTETRKSNLLYEHNDPENSEPVFESISQNAEAILEELITVLPINETKPITAVKFTSFVFSIRKLDVKALRGIWTRFYNCDEEEDSEFTEKQCKKSQ